MLLGTPHPEKHAPLEDIQGITVGAILVAVSVQFLHSGDLITGQIAGLSLILSYISPWSFGLAFFVLNLPFYWLALRRIGPRFTLKTFGAIGLLSLFSSVLPSLITIDALNPYAAAVVAGVTAGAGLLALFRHGASLGGVGIVALYLQDKYQFKAGWTQLMFDVCVFAIAFALFTPDRVLPSLLGAVVLNIIIATNHRRDRYIAT